MKLLILTQEVDQSGSVLGFFHEWISAFSEACEQVTVIALRTGTYTLPENVKVLSIELEDDISKRWHKIAILRKLVYVFRFYRSLFLEHKNYDSVFVHMNKEYVLLGGFLWRISRKKIGFWYAHGHVNVLLRIATFIPQIIFTSTKSGFRIKSKKKRVVGQGIPVEKFELVRNRPKVFALESFRILTIGRISESKDYMTLLKAIKVLRERNIQCRVRIAGGISGKHDGEYRQLLERSVSQFGLEKEIEFLGPVSNVEVPELFLETDLFVNMGKTGSLDKAILEGMAAGVPVLTCNEAAIEILGPYRTNLMYKKGDENEFATKITNIMSMTPEERAQLGRNLRNIVKKDHSVRGLIKKILNEYETL